MKKIALSASLLFIMPLTTTFAAPQQQPVSAPTTTQVSPVAAADALYQQKKFKEAASAYQSLSKQGNGQASYNLGVLYEKGEGVSQSNKKAIEFFTKAASQGFQLGNFALAKAYMTGSLGVAKDIAKGRNYLTLASNAGLPVAQFGLVQVLLQDNKPESTKLAVSYLESLSAKNMLEASHLLALLNLNKDKFVAANTQKAISLLEANAQRGFIPSIALLGEMNLKGNFLKKNLKNAELYFKVLAENKVPQADQKLKEVQAEIAKQK